MRIRTTGVPDNTNRKLVIRAIRFAAPKIGFHPLLLENIRLHLVFSDTPGCKASIEWLDRRTKARSFRMSIRKTMSEENVLLAAFHELVHVRQYASGQLTDLPDGMVRWADDAEVPFDEDTELYWLAPWEIEARGYERGLYKLFIQTEK